MTLPQQGDYGCVSIPWLKKKLFGISVPIPNIVGYLIRLGTWSKYDHSFIYIGSGKIVEAQSKGASVAFLSKYAGNTIIWSADKLSTDQRKGIVSWALSVCGTHYGFLDIFYIALATLGLKFKWLLKRVEREDRLICSQLVAVCGVNGGVSAWLCGKNNACLVTPANLANHANQVLMDHSRRAIK